jgi:hypothetical protein
MMSRAKWDEHCIKDAGHLWNSRYSSFGLCEGVEWFCVNCCAILPWPEAKRRVNAELLREARIRELEGGIVTARRKLGFREIDGANEALQNVLYDIAPKA